MRNRVNTTSSLLRFLTTEELFPRVGLIARSLLKISAFHSVCHLDRIYLLIKGLKLLKGISNVDMFRFSASFAFLSAVSLPCMLI